MRTSDAAGTDATPWDVQLAGTGVVAAAEERLAAHYGMRHAVMVTNATTGLMVLAAALGIRNSEFVTTPYTWGGSIGPWMFLGNRPVFADIDPVTLTLDPPAARRCITRRTRAILSVDVDGTPADDTALRELADAHGAWYISDAAASFGARRDGRPASTRAHAQVLSFGPRKPLDCGEGGAILTDRTDIYERVIYLAQHPSRQARELGMEFANEIAPFNARPHPAAAAALVRSFDAAIEAVQARQRRWLAVNDALDESALVSPAYWSDATVVPSFARFSVAPRQGLSPVDIQAVLQARSFDVHCAPAGRTLIYDQPSFRARRGKGRASPSVCPVAEEQSKSRVAIWFRAADRSTSGTPC